MRPLATTQLMMTWLSMCPVDESITVRQKIGRIANTLFVFFLNVVLFVSSLAYCLKYFSVDFDGAAFGFMCIIGEVGMIYFMIVAIRMRQQIGEIFSNLSTIYEASMFNCN